MPLHGADCVIASRLQWQTVAENSSAPAKLEEPYLARCPKEGSENAYGSRASDKRTGMRETKAGRWIVVSGRIGKQHTRKIGIVNGPGETARLGAHEALPHTPPGGKPPETPGPLSLRPDCRDREGSVKGSQAAPKTGAPLTDPSRSGTGSIDEGKGALGQAGLCRLPLVGPEEWVQTREGKSLLDKNDLLMEDAESF